MDIDMHIYLEDYQETISSPLVKINLLVSFESLA